MDSWTVTLLNRLEEVIVRNSVYGQNIQNHPDLVIAQKHQSL